MAASIVRKKRNKIKKIKSGREEILNIIILICILSAIIIAWYGLISVMPRMNLEFLASINFLVAYSYWAAVASLLTLIFAGMALLTKISRITAILKSHYLTLVIILVLVGVFSAQIATSLFGSIRMFGMVSDEIIEGKRLFTIFTNIWIHTNVIHILGNIFTLAYFGLLVEFALSKKRFLLIYFLSGMAGSSFCVLMLQLIPISSSSGLLLSSIPWKGASTSIFGIAGALFPLYFKKIPKETNVGNKTFGITLGSILSVGGLILIFANIFFLLIDFTKAVNQGAWLHIGGFVVGFVIALIWRIRGSV